MRYNRVTEIYTDPWPLPEADRRPQKKRLKAGTMTLISHSRTAIVLIFRSWRLLVLEHTSENDTITKTDKYYFVSTTNNIVLRPVCGD